jgi:hypothetical protein
MNLLSFSSSQKHYSDTFVCRKVPVSLQNSGVQRFLYFVASKMKCVPKCTPPLAAMSTYNGELQPSDWLMGATIMKTDGAYLRNMLDPTADGYSRSHVSQVECADEDIHRSCGIFNKVRINTHTPTFAIYKLK